MDKFSYIEKLRHEAEQQLKEGANQADFSHLKEFNQLLQELEVYHIELEMQNEELRHTRDRLQIEEEKYFGLFELSPVGYVTVDLDYKIKELNITACEILNLEKITAVGTDFRKFVMPEFQDDFYFFVRDILQNSSRLQCEIQLVSTDKKIFDAQLDTIAHRDKFGNPCELRLVVTNISKWKKQESKLRLSEERFRFLSNLPDPVIVHINGVIVYVNKLGIDIYGYSEGNILGKNILDFIYQEDRAIVISNMSKKMQGLPFLTEYEIRLVDLQNNIRNAELKVTTIDYDNKNAEIVLIRDITVHKQTELALRDYAAFHAVKSIIRSNYSNDDTDYIWSVFIESLLREFRCMGTAVFKYKSDCYGCVSLAGKFSLSIDEYSLYVALEEMMGTKFPLVNEFGMLKDFYLVDNEGNKVSHQDTDDNFGLIPFMIDGSLHYVLAISFSDKIQNSKRKIDRINELLDDFKWFSFVNKSDKVQPIYDISRLKNEFLACISHEIRTPLNPIIGFITYLLNEFKLPSEAVEILKIMENSSKDLLHTLNALLDMSKLLAGSIELCLEPFNFKDAVTSLANQYKFKANALAYEFVVSIDEKLDNIYIGDSAKINQSVANILDNAIKFSFKSGSRIVFKVYEESYDDSETLANIKISVSDEGIGIREDFIPYVVQAFGKANNTQIYNQKGIGLGLAIASKLIELMQGRLAIESRENAGTSVAITLPLSKEKSVEKQNWSDGTIEKKKILVAEDDDANKFLLESILSMSNRYELTFAQNGEEAYSKFLADQYDLILMDIKMPRLDGESATIKIRQHETYSNKSKVPIIGVTAQAAVGSKEKYIQSGMNDVLFKPFDNTILLSTIENLLHK